MRRIGSLLACALLISPAAVAQISVNDLDNAAKSLQPKIISWRRDIHEHPELSNREVRTSQFVAKQLTSLGLQVKTGVGLTGVAALLKGGQPGPTIALRADMDALPVTEQVDVPFKSKVTAQFRGESVGVMHACGHDAHT
ncbi:MAG: M20/M25/M40 family metallo-hydrolase, partial [Povalibacter sp.]